MNGTGMTMENRELIPAGNQDHKWGQEIRWASNTDYCAKILVFNRKGDKTKLKIHKEKRKSWFVNAGKFEFKFIDVSTGQVQSAIIEEGKTVDLGEMSPHQIEALEPNSIIFEVGTPDWKDDDFLLAE